MAIHLKATRSPITSGNENLTDQSGDRTDGSQNLTDLTDAARGAWRSTIGASGADQLPPAGLRRWDMTAAAEYQGNTPKPALLRVEPVATGPASDAARPTTAASEAISALWRTHGSAL